MKIYTLTISTDKKNLWAQSLVFSTKEKAVQAVQEFTSSIKEEFPTAIIQHNEDQTYTLETLFFGNDEEKNTQYKIKETTIDADIN